MGGRNAITKQIASSLQLTTSYQTVEYPDDLGAIFAKGGQVVFTVKRTGGTNTSFKIDEKFSELTGFIPKTEDDGSALSAIERTNTEASYSYAFQSIAEKAQIQLKGADDPVVDVFITVGEIE